MNQEKTKPLIFLVEDDEFFAGTVTLGLENQEYETVWISHGETLLDMLKTRQPDVIVLDYQLNGKYGNGMNGGHILDIIRTMCPALPVIMLTSLADTREAVKLLKTGAVDFISKDDYFFENLLKSLNSILLARDLSKDLRNARKQLTRLKRRLAAVLVAAAAVLVVLIALYT